MSADNNDDGDFGSLKTYDPTDDVDLEDFGGGVDESPDVNEDGEIVSSSSDGEVRDFAMEDDRDVSSDDGGTTETTKTTLDQQGIDGENIFAGSDDDNTDEDDGFETYTPSSELDTGGIGGGRTATLDAIERRDRLDTVEADDIEDIDDLTGVIREIHLDGYMSPPRNVINTIESVYNTLPDEAKPEYLTDEILLRRINSARQYFDETVLPRLKRVKEMPSPVEAGRANYPADKARRRSEKHRDAAEELSEKLGTKTGTSGGVKSAANGAKQRALNAIGSSVAEENEKARKGTRESMRNRVETGDVVVYGMPTPNVGEVIRVNKKSVTARRPNPQHGNEDPLTGEIIDEEDIEGRAEYDESTLGLIEEDDLGDLEENTPLRDAGKSNVSKASFDSFDELRKDVGLPIERESDYVKDEQRECTQKLCETADIAEHRAATVVDHFGDYEAAMKGAQDVGKDGLKELDGIGDTTAEKVVDVALDSEHDPSELYGGTDDADGEGVETEEVDIDELAHDTPPTWELDATPEDDERGWSYWWECDTGDRIHAKKEFGEESYMVEHLVNTEDEHRTLAEGLPSKRDAIEVAVGSMEANKCVLPEDRHSQALDRGVSFSELQAQSRADRREELDSRKLETGNQFEKRNKLPDSYDPTAEFEDEKEDDETAPYDPTVDFENLFGGDVPDEETQKEVLAEDSTDDEDDDVEQYSAAGSFDRRTLRNVDAQDEIGEFEKVEQDNHKLRYERETETEKHRVEAKFLQGTIVFEIVESLWEAGDLDYATQVEQYTDDDKSLEYDSLADRVADETENHVDRLELERRAPTGWEVGYFDARAPEVRFDDGCFVTGQDNEYCRFVRATADDVRIGALDEDGEVFREDSTGHGSGDTISKAVEVMADMERGDVLEEVGVEFGAKETADAFRDDHAEHLHPNDDARSKTVFFDEDTPDNVLEEARKQAVETRADKTKDSYGQAKLTEREKGEIDFSETSLFHAQTVKAIAAGEGVSNWLDYYDRTLTADEHIDIMQNAKAASRLDSDELDDETVDEKLAEMEKTAESQECDHAESGCKDGYEEACDFLVEECGVPQNRVDEFLDEDDFDGSDAEMPGDSDLDSDDLPLEVRIALKKAWTGYRAGRAEAKEGGAATEARMYAGIINSIRQGIGQDMIGFESAGAFEGGVVEPDEVGAEFEPRFEAYDPTEEIL
ncbi:MAG: hypothetical protein U5J64_11210 [Halobacteriales archaeon]|nr:hypothetical protein [Halobacteriales archaeon]